MGLPVINNITIGNPMDFMPLRFLSRSPARVHADDGTALFVRPIISLKDETARKNPVLRVVFDPITLVRTAYESMTD